MKCSAETQPPLPHILHVPACCVPHPHPWTPCLCHSRQAGRRLSPCPIQGGVVLGSRMSRAEGARSADNCGPYVGACWIRDQMEKQFLCLLVGVGVSSGLGKLQPGKTFEVGWRGSIHGPPRGTQGGPCWANDQPPSRPRAVWHPAGLETCGSCPHPECLPLLHPPPGSSQPRSTPT